MKNKPISFFLFLALAFIHEANAGKIVGALEASYGTIVSPEYELMDREWEPFGNETWEPFGNETTDIGKTDCTKMIYDYLCICTVERVGFFLKHVNLSSAYYT